MNTEVNPGGLALLVVMPVYNEEAVIRTVVEDWLRVLDGLAVSYRLRVRNDGSTDDTAETLGAVRHSRLEVIDSDNRGHGPTLVAEYSRAFELAEWVFQTDSDGEVSAEDFPAFWAARESSDLLIGVRQNRGGPLSRRFMTRCVRFLLRRLFGGGIQDGNCPFRLMRSEGVKPALAFVPENAFAPNVLLSGFALRTGLRITEHPVSFHPRSTGTVSIRRGKLFRVAWTSAVQTMRFYSRVKSEHALQVK